MAEKLMKKVIIYTTVWCPWCKRTKEFFKKHKIKFEERDVEDDPKSAEEMVKKSGQSGIPVTDIEGKIIIGFDEPALRKELGIKD